MTADFKKQKIIDGVMKKLTPEIEKRISEAVVGIERLVADEVAKYSLSPRAKINLATQKIINDIYDEWGVTFKEIASPARSKSIVLARHDLMTRLMDTGRYSSVTIGKLLNKDHSSVLFGVRSHRQRQEDAAFVRGQGA